MFYRVFRILFIVIYRLLFRYVTIGKENIPSEGAVLLCSNHISLHDPPIVGIQTTREMHFMAKKELFSIPIVSYVIRKLNAFPVNRGYSDKAAFRKSLQILREKNVLLIFPEGTRLKTGRYDQVGECYSGTGLIALKEPCQVIPISIVGPYRLFRKTIVAIGEPVQLDDLRKEKITSQEARVAAQRIREHMQQLIDAHVK